MADSLSIVSETGASLMILTIIRNKFRSKPPDMFVCLCNAIKDTEIRDLARTGSRTAQGIYEALGCDPCCAICVDEIQEIVDGEAVPAAG